MHCLWFGEHTGQQSREAKTLPRFYFQGWKHSPGYHDPNWTLNLSAGEHALFYNSGSSGENRMFLFLTLKINTSFQTHNPQTLTMAFTSQRSRRALKSAHASWELGGDGPALEKCTVIITATPASFLQGHTGLSTATPWHSAPLTSAHKTNRPCYTLRLSNLGHPDPPSPAQSVWTVLRRLNKHDFCF